MDKLYAAASCPKEKLVIKGAVHARACMTDPELYLKTLDQFLEKYVS